MVRDRAILSKFLTHRVVQEYPVPRGKFQFSPLLAAILEFPFKAWREIHTAAVVLFVYILKNCSFYCATMAYHVGLNAVLG